MVSVWSFIFIFFLISTFIFIVYIVYETFRKFKRETVMNVLLSGDRDECFQSL